MGRAPCCAKVGLRTGPWSAKEDTLLINYIRVHGEGHWRNLPKRAGLLRCGKSCRLRWMNYLRPDIKRGNISSDEEDLIIRLHSLLGNRWSLIAKRLPGRTDNEIKNYWNSHLSKRVETSTSKVSTSNDQRPKPSKKRSQSSTNEKKQKKKNSNNNINEEETANVETTKTKIYLPKAVRVSPYSIAIRNMIGTFDNMASGSPSSSASPSPSADEEGNNNIRQNHEGAGDAVPWWPHLIEEEAEAGPSGNEEEYSPQNLNDISFLDFVPIEDNMLDEIIDEYQQLLNFEDNVQFDSFSV